MSRRERRATLAQLETNSGGALRVEVLDFLDVLGRRRDLAAAIIGWLERLPRNKPVRLTCSHTWDGSAAGPPPVYFTILTPARADPQVRAIAAVCWTCSFRDGLRDAVLKSLRQAWPNARWANHVPEASEVK